MKTTKLIYQYIDAAKSEGRSYLGIRGCQILGIDVNKELLEVLKNRGFSIFYDDSTDYLEIAWI